MSDSKQNTKSNLVVTDWKKKSIKRGKEAKALNKRIREITTSRDVWKTKYMNLKAQSIIKEDELNNIKKKLSEILNPQNNK